MEPEVPSWNIGSPQPNEAWFQDVQAQETLEYFILETGYIFLHPSLYCWMPLLSTERLQVTPQ